MVPKQLSGSISKRDPFADLDRQVTKAAAVLKDLNIGKGDRVAFLLPKGLMFIELYLATLGLGAIALPLNPAYRPEEILYFLSDSESSLVIIHSEKQAEIGPVLNQIPSLQVLVIDREVPQTYYYPRLLKESLAGPGPLLSHPGGRCGPALLYLGDDRSFQRGHDYP